MRLYAIGDVHGCDDLLARTHSAIEADLLQRPVDDYRVIHLGDYVDRGPDTAAVLDRVIRMRAQDRERIICLGGNHEDLLLLFLDSPVEARATFLRFGGIQTMRSYGVAVDNGQHLADVMDLRRRFAEAFPAKHREFIEALPSKVKLGDFLFCHAGIRPGVPLDNQDNNDLRWIREAFHNDTRDYGFVVVHGHTPVDQPEVRPNRINIDTGAVFTGRLTCLALEGTEHRFL
jgi:serine/threonine protein phosphatase 1